jgi:kanosamine 6-kinase
MTCWETMTPISAWLALDIGATKLAVRAQHGAQAPTRTVAWQQDDVATLTSAIAAVRAQSGGRIDRVGVACAPTLDDAGRVVAWPSRPSWTGLPLRSLIEEAAGAPAFFGDDGSLAALAEADAVGCADLVFLGIGTGLGGGVVSGGRLVTGAFGSAGEIGHVPLDPAGPVCVCGRRGCVQATVSGPALAAVATRLRRRPTTTYDLIAGIEQGRGWALRVRSGAVTALARTVVLLSEVVQPARVHVGGGVGSALDGLPQLISEAMRPLARPGHPLPEVAAARLGTGASLDGALLLARTGAPRLATA